MGYNAHTGDVLEEVLLERERQDAKWGQQNHPIGAEASDIHVANSMRIICDEAFKRRVGTWREIANEEFWEAFSETDPVKRRAELVQLAAVVVAAIESEDRKAGKF